MLKSSAGAFLRNLSEKRRSAVPNVERRARSLRLDQRALIDTERSIRKVR